MNKYEQLKQKVRKAIKPCEDCEGKGFNYSEPVQIGESSSNCKQCGGKGYIEEFEFGCEVEVDGFEYTIISKQLAENIFCLSKDKSNTRFFDTDEIQNIGKPITLQEILLALSRNYSDRLGFIDGYIYVKYLGIKIPLNLTPDQYDEKLMDKLIEIL